MPKKTDSGLLVKKIKASWQKAFLKLIPLGGFSSGNSVKIFHTGDEAFFSIKQEIDCASASIFFETYILTPDKVGLWVRDALIQAQRRGVFVTVLYDHFGSAGLSHSFLQPMRDVGIKVMAFNPIWPWRRKGPLLFRDHRKIIVIDERVAFCGSMNIGADYAGPILGNDRFRDSVAHVSGPCVSDLLAITRESIAESEFEQVPEAFEYAVNSQVADTIQAGKLFFSKFASFGKKLPSPNVSHKEKALVQVLRSNNRRNLAHIQHSMEEAVNRAVSYCYFTTPYFLPLSGLQNAIINAQRRGVDVRVLTAGLSDIPLMRQASRHVYRRFIKAGVRIYEMTRKTLHAKIACIDGVYSSIGSYNLDHWSARRNLEVNLCVIDQQISRELKEQFEKDLALSREINQEKFLARSYLARFLSWVAYLFFKL